MPTDMKKDCYDQLDAKSSDLVALIDSTGR